MNERLQYAVLSNALKVVTRFTQSICSTDGLTDAESLSNEMIKCNVTSFDVPSVFSRCAHNLFLYGKTGQGKTVAIDHELALLQEYAASQDTLNLSVIKTSANN